VDRLLRDGAPAGHLIPLYFFDQATGAWHAPVLSDDGKTLAWGPRDPPKPEGLYAGIGTRELEDNGAKAIAALF
jgi:hypothetical protein